MWIRFTGVRKTEPVRNVFLRSEVSPSSKRRRGARCTWTLMGTPNSTLAEQTWNQSHSPVWKKISEMNINNSTFFLLLNRCYQSWKLLRSDCTGRHQHDVWWICLENKKISMQIHLISLSLPPHSDLVHCLPKVFYIMRQSSTIQVNERLKQVKDGNMLTINSLAKKLGLKKSI